MPRRRVDPADGEAALAVWAEHGSETARADLLTATRYALEELAALHPGHAVEVRVPPAGAVQAFGGPRHTRGTPPNVIECRPHTFLALATGRLAWRDALGAPIDEGGVSASGARADLEEVLPFLRPRLGWRP